MDDGEASKLWIAGGGTTAVTVTVVDCVAVWPAPSVTVSVYVVETGGVTVTDPPLAMTPTPLSMLPVPPLNVAERVALSPAVMLCGAAVKLWIAGGGATASGTIAIWSKYMAGSRRPLPSFSAMRWKEVFATPRTSSGTAQCVNAPAGIAPPPQ